MITLRTGSLCGTTDVAGSLFLNPNCEGTTCVHEESRAMRITTTNRAHAGRILVVLAPALLSGCGGGNGGNAEEQGREFSYGPIITRVAGASQAPVTASGFGAVATGVAGASVTSLIVNVPGVTVETSKIAIVAGGPVRDVFVMNSDGGGLKNITNNTKGSGAGVSWSPDGKQIAFDSSRDGTSHIYVINADGTGITALTRETDFRPVWSPDGKKIVFGSVRDKAPSIYVMNTNGSAQTRLTAGNTVDTGPLSWSPDSRQIAFADLRDNGSIPQIYTMGANGASQLRVRPDVDTQIETDPAWSPDGTRIAFVRRSQTATDLFLMNPDGSGLVNLTNTPAAPKSSPTWSPDGKRIAFVSKGDVFAISAGGGVINRLTLLGNVVSASWGPPAHTIPLIGTTAPLSAAAGFLFATSGTTLSSIVTFDATTRTAARVSSQTGQSSSAPNIVFNIDSGDSLTRLQYMNNLGAAPTVVIGPGGASASATHALVSFSAATGKVAFVLPFVANRSAGTTEVQREGGELVYRGSFLGVWDETGENRAPHGASEVLVDAQSGKIASVR
jgi:Tol biopolymer transport system component